MFRKNLAVDHLPLEHGFDIKTRTSNCEPDSNALVTLLLDVCGSREMPKNLDLEDSVVLCLRWQDSRFLWCHECFRSISCHFRRVKFQILPGEHAPAPILFAHSYVFSFPLLLPLPLENLLCMPCKVTSFNVLYQLVLFYVLKLYAQVMLLFSSRF